MVFVFVAALLTCWSHTRNLKCSFHVLFNMYNPLPGSKPPYLSCHNFPGRFLLSVVNDGLKMAAKLRSNP